MVHDKSMSAEVMSVAFLDVEEHVDSALLICRFFCKPDIIACPICRLFSSDIRWYATTELVIL